MTLRKRMTRSPITITWKMPQLLHTPMMKKSWNMTAMATQLPRKNPRWYTPRFSLQFCTKGIGPYQLFLSYEVHIKIGRQGGVHRRSICPLPTLVGGGVASWSVCSTPDRVVWVQVLAGHIVWEVPLCTQGPVVQKPINANLRLKINQGVYFSTPKCCSTLIFGKSLH